MISLLGSLCHIFRNFEVLRTRPASDNTELIRAESPFEPSPLGVGLFIMSSLTQPISRHPRVRSLLRGVQILPDSQVAQTLGGILASLFTLFSGFLISPEKIQGSFRASISVAIVGSLTSAARQ